MFKRILLIILLIALTLYGIIIINFVYSFGFSLLIQESRGLESTSFKLFYCLFVGPLVSLLFLLLIFVYGIFKETINKTYLYTYLGFLVFLVIFYFGYFTRYEQFTFIPESEFETKLQNIEVKDEENGLIMLDGFRDKYKDDFKKIDLFDYNNKASKNYRCIISNIESNCKDINLKEFLDKSKLFFTNSIQSVEKINKNVLNIANSKYFKLNPKMDKYPSLQGFTMLARINLYNVIYNLEKFNKTRALELLSLYPKFGNKFLLGDNSLVGMIVGISIERISNDNINYILDNYSFNSSELEKLKDELNYNYDAEKIFSNTIKLEYQISKYGLEKENIKSSILFNKEEFLNEQRNVKLSIINEEDNFYKNYETFYIKRNFIYYTLGKMMYFNFDGYMQEIEDFNKDRGEIIEKINRKLGE